MAKLRRTVATYEAIHPEAVASGSKAQMMYFIEDATADIANLADAKADLVDALQLCQRALANIVAPDAIQQTTVTAAYAQAMAAEAKARAVLAAQAEV
ncbi:hypothetical protein [Devosia sp. DBB001]|nr:hypothetical protein [Devosia sp. DBB001]